MTYSTGSRKPAFKSGSVMNRAAGKVGRSLWEIREGSSGMALTVGTRSEAAGAATAGAESVCRGRPYGSRSRSMESAMLESSKMVS